MAFSRRSRAVKAKKSTYLNLLLFDVLVAVAAVVSKPPQFFKQCDGFYYVPFQLKRKDERDNFTGTIQSTNSKKTVPSDIPPPPPKGTDLTLFVVNTAALS